MYDNYQIICKSVYTRNAWIKCQFLPDFYQTLLCKGNCKGNRTLYTELHSIYISIAKAGGFKSLSSKVIHRVL